VNVIGIFTPVKSKKEILFKDYILEILRIEN